nr:hypothetical protein [Pandoravirus massiliensis]
MDRPDPRDNRALLVQALRARVASPGRDAAPAPLHDFDVDTLGVIADRAAARLAEAINIVLIGGSMHPHYRGALAHVERLEYGAQMPLLARALCDTAHGRRDLDVWLDTLRRLYEAFWRGVAATPSAIPLGGRALGSPPTPRSVNRWLRAHFGPDAVAPPGMDRAEVPLEGPRQWAEAAGDAIESLWRHAAQGVHRVPDVWPVRRTLLWEHGVCSPETLFVLAVAQDIPIDTNDDNDAKEDDQASRQGMGHTNTGAADGGAMGIRNNTVVGGTHNSDGQGRDYHAQTNGDERAPDDNEEDDGDRNDDSDVGRQLHADDTAFTRTAVLYAATSAAHDSRDNRVLRVVCHASLVVAMDSQSEETLSVFTSADAANLLASLSLPPAVPWTTVEAVQRWLASLADGGSLRGIAKLLLAPRSEPARDIVEQQAKAAGDAVRTSLDDVDHNHSDSFARLQQQYRHHHHPHGARILFLFSSSLASLFFFWAFRVRPLSVSLFFFSTIFFPSSFVFFLPKKRGG